MAGSMLNGSTLGDFYSNASIRSTGGLVTLAFGIAAASRYSDEGKLGGTVRLAFSSGIVIGLIAVAIAPVIVILRWG